MASAYRSLANTAGMVNLEAVVTFKVGFNTSVGFSGTVQTGYSTTAEINYEFQATGWNGEICGEDNYPSASDPGPAWR
jgi:hypothetical protein